MAILGSGNDNINIDGATSEFIDFGGADTYTILGSLSGDVTITDNQASTINLPDGLTVTDALFLADGVQFTIDGNTVTLLGNPSLFTFVFGGTPLDASAGTPLSFDDTAAAFGTTVPAPGDAPNAATNLGDINDDGTVSGGVVPLTFDLSGPSSSGEAETATYTVTASVPVTVETEVTFQLVAGDEAAPDQGTSDTNLNDFTQGSFTETTVTIPVGGTTATFSVTPRSDGITELTEDFSVEASVGATVLTPITTSIIDGGGETAILTTNVDNITDPVDLVRGLLNDDGADDLDTFSSGDFIQGNGDTEVRLTLVDGTTADFVEMDGVNALTFNNAGIGNVTFDATSYGSGLNIFTLSGADGADVEVDNVEFDDGPLIFDVAPDTTGTLDVSGETGLFTTFSVDISVSGDDGASLISDIGNAGIEVFAGENSDVELDADIDVTETGSDAIIDPITIGDVNLVAETSAEADVEISIEADANTAGNATIGDTTIGDVDLTAGTDASVTFTLEQSASASSGNAIVGDLLIGDVDMIITGSGGEIDLSISRDADASTGDATIGNTTVGNIDIVLADDADTATFDVSVTASVDTGTATVGNLLIGDISVDAGESSDVTIEVFQYATADTSGDAIAGDITLGSIDATLGDFADMSVSISQPVIADSGNATAGNWTLGDITVDLGEDATFDVDLSSEATADSGFLSTIGDVTVGNLMLTQASGADVSIDISVDADASGDGSGVVGNVMLGDVTSVMGLSSSLDISIDVSASGTGTMTHIGGVTVGDVTLSSDPAGLQANAELGVDVHSDGTIGAVMVGAVDVDFLEDSTFDYDINVTAGTGNDGAVGPVMLGDVDVVADSNNYFVGIFGDMTAGVDIGNIMLSGDDIEWNNITLSASADIGDVTIGNIMLDAGTNLSVSTGIEINATGDIGSVDIGEIDIDFVNNESFSIDVFASDDLGDVSIGDISLGASATASAPSSVFGFVSIEVSGNQDVGNVAVGDITILGSGGGSNFGSASVIMDFDAGTGDDLGNVTLGDIDLTSVALDFDPGGVGVFNNVSATIGGTADSVGDVVIGDISLNATAENVAADADADNDEAQPSVRIFGDQGSTLLSMLIGDIDIILTNSVDSSTGFTGLDYNGAAASLSVTSDVAITIGDINISAVNDSTVDVQGGVGAGLFNANLNISSDGGADDITIGDISISGGDVDASGTSLDNFGNLTGVLGLNGDTITVGDVDYSGYSNDATIDVSDFVGAENIMAASADSDITVNDTQNIITLGDGDDTVIYEAEEQSGTTEADIDQIIDFTSGSDVIDLSFFALGGTAGIGGTVADYATFLTSAQAAMTFDNFDVFTQTDGTNTYVAVNSDNDADEIIDFVIQLTGVTTVATGDFNL